MINFITKLSRLRGSGIGFRKEIRESLFLGKAVLLSQLLASLVLLVPSMSSGANESRIDPQNTNSPVYLTRPNGDTATGPSKADYASQAELIRKLVDRLDQIERKDAEREAAIQTIGRSYEARELALQKRISELESKLGTLAQGNDGAVEKTKAAEGPTVAELDQQIRVLTRKNELAAEAAAEREKSAPKVSAGPNGFSLASADTNFVLKLRGLVQLDSRSFFDDNPLSTGNDTFVLRRARPILEGTLFRDFDFQFVPDFGGSSVAIFDAWLNYRYQPWLQLRAGKFKGPVGFENLQVDWTLPFNERSLVSGFLPVRSLGLQLWGDVADGRFSYAAGIFNGSGDGRNPSTVDFSDAKEFAGRVAFQPLKDSGDEWLRGIGFGVGGSYMHVHSNSAALPSTTGGTLPGYMTSGFQQFFAYNPSGVTPRVVADGDHWRISPYVTYLRGPFGLLAEYLVTRQGVLNNSTLAHRDLEHTAWQVSAQWVLTGEPASFTGITPKRPFNLHSGDWGAWQLVARYAEADLDNRSFPDFADGSTSASGASSWSVGINWWLNKNIRVMTSYSHTSFEGGGAYRAGVPAMQVPPATVTHQSENALFTRIQLSF